MALFDCYGTPHLTTVVRTRETEVVKRLVKPLLLEPEQPISLSLSLSCVDFPRVRETEKERKQDQKLRPWLLSVLPDGLSFAMIPSIKKIVDVNKRGHEVLFTFDWNDRQCQWKIMKIIIMIIILYTRKNERIISKNSRKIDFDILSHDWKQKIFRKKR